MKTKSFLAVTCTLALWLGISGCGDREEKVALKSITVAPASPAVAVGETVQLTATPVPADADDVSFVWSVSTGAEYASVSTAGLVTGLKAGSAIIKVASGSIDKTVTVTVSALPVPVTGITIAPATVADLILNVDGSDRIQLAATPVPENATDYSPVWSATPEGVVSVSQDGLVVATGAGTAVVKAASGAVEKTVTVKVVERVSSITVTPETVPDLILNDNERGRIQLAATPVPEDAVDYLPVWSVTPETGVVSVSQEGLVVATGEGTATVKVASGDIEATVEIRVLPEPVLTTGITMTPATAPGDLMKFGVNGSDRIQLAATPVPEDATDYSPVWSVTPEGVVSVSQDGLVVATGAGTAVVKVTSGAVEATIEITAVAATTEMEKGTWTATASSEWQPNGNTGPLKVLDNNKGSFWHACPGAWVGCDPGDGQSWLLFDMQKVREISGIKFWHRQDDQARAPQHILFELSNDGENWETLLDEENLSQNYTEEIDLPAPTPKAGQYLKITILGNKDGSTGYSYFAEAAPY
ncbi:MAG: Ig-like domain-containing protein [Bacteroidales bacterium]|jgi:uncharacterized protein YjdB|nr:Ig-like domain-containing protein [Bacteroidales bacterium]